MGRRRLRRCYPAAARVEGMTRHSRRYYVIRGIVRSVWITSAVVFCFYCVIR